MDRIGAYLALAAAGGERGTRVRTVAPLRSRAERERISRECLRDVLWEVSVKRSATIDKLRLLGLSRRSFLKLGGASAVGAACSTASPAKSGLAPQTRGYPRLTIPVKQALSVDSPLAFNYPDESSPCVVLKLGRPVLGGVGPDEDVVAFSVLCVHMGCPLAFEPRSKVFKCSCHFSQFDAERGGQMISGQATSALPRITLEFDAANGQVVATGVEGLIYGRVTNTFPS